jgi:hypothetical protein
LPNPGSHVITDAEHSQPPANRMFKRAQAEHRAEQRRQDAGALLSCCESLDDRQMGIKISKWRSALLHDRFARGGRSAWHQCF